MVDRVIALKEGTITEITHPAAVLQDEDTAGKLGVALNLVDDASEDLADAKVGEAPPPGDRQEPFVIEEDRADPEADVSRKKADFTVYTYYLENAGYVAISCYVVAVIGWIFCTEFSSKSSARRPI